MTIKSADVGTEVSLGNQSVGVTLKPQAAQPVRGQIAPGVLLTSGTRRASSDGATMLTTDPTTEAVITEVAKATPANAEESVQAASRAFEEGPWGRVREEERDKILFRLADPLNKSHFQMTRWILTLIALIFVGISAVASCQSNTSEQELPDTPRSDYAPMTGHERWNDFVHQNFAQPGVFFQTFFSALGDQTSSVPSNWGAGADKFPEHLGSEFARFTIGGTVKSTLAAGLQEDTRYFSCKCKNSAHRAVHAVSRVVLTYDRNGKTTVNFAEVAGLYSGPMIMTTWYPGNYTALGYGVRQGNIAAAITAGIYLIREFGPDLKHTLHHRR